MYVCSRLNLLRINALSSRLYLLKCITTTRRDFMSLARKPLLRCWCNESPIVMRSVISVLARLLLLRSRLFALPVT